MNYDLGYIDLEEKTLQPLNNPFGPKVLPMSQERSVTYVSGPDNILFGAPGGTRTPGLLIRSQSLYPAELRARCLIVSSEHR